MFFFFQAEDGIRDLTVTGVQTCALLVSRSVSQSFAPSLPGDVRDELLPDHSLSKCGCQAASLPANDRGPHQNHLARCIGWPAPDNAVPLRPRAYAKRRFRECARA